MQRDREALEKLKAKGMIVNPIDKTSFVTAALPLQDQLAKTLGGEDLLKLVRDTK